MFTSPNATDPFQIAAMRAPRKKFSSDAVRESKSNAAVENHFCDVGSMIQASMTEGSKRFGRFSGLSPNRRQRHANRRQRHANRHSARGVFCCLHQKKETCGARTSRYAGTTQSGKSAESLRTF